MAEIAEALPDFNNVMDAAQVRFLAGVAAMEVVNDLKNASQNVNSDEVLGFRELLDAAVQEEELRKANVTSQRIEMLNYQYSNIISDLYNGRSFQLTPYMADVIRYNAPGGFNGPRVKFETRPITVVFGGLDLASSLSHGYYFSAIRLGSGMRRDRDLTVRPFHKSDPRRYVDAVLLD